jgi:hypothetical protein
MLQTSALDHLQKLAFKGRNSPRNYGSVIHLDGENKRMIYTDGFSMLYHPYEGETKTIRANGMDSPVEYPNTNAIINSCLKPCEALDTKRLFPIIKHISSSFSGKNMPFHLGVVDGAIDIVSSDFEGTCFNPFLLKMFTQGILKKDEPIEGFLCNKGLLKLVTQGFTYIGVALTKNDK